MKHVQSKKMEEKLTSSDNIFKKLTDQSLLGIVIIQDNKFIYFNDAISEITEYTNEELMKWDFEDWLKTIHPEDLSMALKRMQMKLEGDSTLTSFRIFSKTGKIKHLESHGSRIFFNRKYAIITSILDVTRRLIVEEDLRKSKIQLQAAYEQVTFYKDLFTHDIANILNNIKISTGLYKYYKKNLNYKEKIEEMIEIINEQVLSAVTLISNVRKLSKYETKGEKTLKSVNICNILKTAIDYIYQSYNKNKVVIYGNFPQMDLKIMANELLLDVFQNILINAVKYNKSVPVKILINMSKEEDETIRVEFIDNGIGITELQKKLIFKEGFKREKRSKGMGLGLSLVKKLVGSYNGKLFVEDKVKGDYTQGTKFILTFPLNL